MANWKEFRQELELTPEEECIIELEKDLIRTMVQIRESQGLSQAELGEKVGLSADRIQKYENGARKPKNDMLKNIFDTKKTIKDLYVIFLFCI